MVLAALGALEGGELDIWVLQGTESVEAVLSIGSSGMEKAVCGEDDWKNILSLGAGALLCYEATSSRFRAVTLRNWKWLLMRSMVCKQSEGCEETLVLIETGEGE